LSFFLREFFLAHTAERTIPVSRKIFERGAGLYAAARVSSRGIINIATRVATILFHGKLLPEWN
jgi:hypothetical protein